MRRLLLSTALSFALPLGLMGVSADSQAHGPTRQKVTETIDIAAPPAKVWAAIKDFSTLHVWHPAVDACEATRGNAVGSVRTLTLGGGGKVVEALKKHDDAGMSYSYKMTDPGPVPVSNYSSTIAVAASGEGSVVSWKGAFYRGYPNNDPPPELNDEAAIAAVTGIYRSGLANLKKMVEGK